MQEHVQASTQQSYFQFVHEDLDLDDIPVFTACPVEKIELLPQEKLIKNYKLMDNRHFFYGSITPIIAKTGANDDGLSIFINIVYRQLMLWNSSVKSSARHKKIYTGLTVQGF